MSSSVRRSFSMLTQRAQGSQSHVAPGGRLFLDCNDQRNSNDDDQDTDESAWRLPDSVSTSDLIQRARFQGGLYAGRSQWQRRLVQTVTFVDDSSIKRSMSIDLRGVPFTALLNSSSFDRDSFFLPVLPAMRSGPILDIDAVSASGRSLNVARRLESIEATTLQIVGTVWLRPPKENETEPEHKPWVKELALTIFRFLADQSRTRNDLIRALIGEKAAASLDDYYVWRSHLFREMSRAANSDHGITLGDPRSAHILKQLKEYPKKIIDPTRLDEAAALREAPDDVFTFLFLGTASTDSISPPFLDEICEQRRTYTLHVLYTPSRDSQNSVEDEVIKISWLEKYETDEARTASLTKLCSPHLLLTPKSYSVEVPIFGPAGAAGSTHLRVVAPEDMALGRVSVVRGGGYTDDRGLLRHWPDPRPDNHSSSDPEEFVSTCPGSKGLDSHPRCSAFLSDNPLSPTVEVIANDRQVEVLRHGPHKVPNSPSFPLTHHLTAEHPWKVLVVLNPKRRYFLAPALLNLTLTLILVFGVFFVGSPVDDASAQETTVTISCLHDLPERTLCTENADASPSGVSDTSSKHAPITSFITIILSALTFYLAVPREHALITASQSHGRVISFVASTTAACYALLLAFGYGDWWQAAAFWVSAPPLVVAIIYLFTRIVLIECSTIEAFRLRHNLRNLGPTDSGRLDVPRYHDLPARLRRALWLAGLHQLVLRMLSGSVSDMRFRNRVARWWDAAVEASTATSHRSSGTNPASGS